MNCSGRVTHFKLRCTLRPMKDIGKNAGELIALLASFTWETTSRSKSDKLPISNRVVRTIAFFLFAVLVGAGATLIVFPPVGWLSPSATQAPVPSVTAAELQEQLKPLAVDLALMRRSMEQLGSNLDQLARKQDQLAQSIATLQAAEQQVSQTASTPPSPPKAVSALPPKPKAVHVPLPPPKALQTPAQ